MKKTYTFEITEHTALNRKKYCKCGSHIYEIWRQMLPDEHTEHGEWSVYCPNCGRETPQTYYKKTAMEIWKTSPYI